MPGVPMLMPSDTVMVPKMMDFPPAASAPAAVSRASWSMCMLHGVTMLQVEAMPTMGFAKSASPKPTARSMERFGVRSGPSTTTAEWARNEAGGREDLELMKKHAEPVRLREPAEARKPRLNRNDAVGNREWILLRQRL